MVRLTRAWLGLLIILCWTLPAVAAPAETAKKPQESDYELYKMLVDTIDQVERNYVTEVNRRELIEAAIRGVLSKLDPYSSYIGAGRAGAASAPAWRASSAASGFRSPIDDGQLRILSPMYGTPAYRAGLLAGDRILEIDGKSTDGLTLDEAVEKLKGDEGTTVTLTVVHPGKEAKEKVTLKREKIHVDTVLGDRRKADGSWEFMLDPKQHIGYVRLTAFSRDTAAAVAARA